VRPGYDPAVFTGSRCVCEHCQEERAWEDGRRSNRYPTLILIDSTPPRDSTARCANRSALTSSVDFERSRGLKSIYLDNFHDFKVAIALYRKGGYVSREPYHDNPQATVFLRKDLD
jgi:hypothetical protein